MSDFWDYFNNEWLPDFEKFMKKTIGEFTKPIRLAFLKPVKAPHIVYAKYLKKGGTLIDSN